MPQITGIGEGGSKDTLEQCAGSLIGKNPFKIEAIWQEEYMAWFYPPGREKQHAMGALDLALWDIKGKALGLPIHQLLGGAVRNYCECYNTGNVRPPDGPGGAPPTVKDRVQATLAAGYKVYQIRMVAFGAVRERKCKTCALGIQVCELRCSLGRSFFAAATMRGAGTQIAASPSGSRTPLTPSSPSNYGQPDQPGNGQPEVHEDGWQWGLYVPDCRSRLLPAAGGSAGFQGVQRPPG